ncbi:MAG: ABC transporter permease [Thermodesulfovibrio sp.]|nr:ABC transporter permease [Thermodesulfovibrio sp.]
MTLIGISASIAILFSIFSFNRGFERNIKKETEKTGLHFMIVPSGCPHEVASLILHGAVSPKFLDMDITEKLRSFREIELISPIIVTQAPNIKYDRIDILYGIEFSILKILKPYWDIEGNIPTNDYEIIIGSDIAEHYKIKIGDTLNYKGVQFRVSGIVKRTFSQEDAYVYISLKSLQKLLNKEGKASAIGIRIKNIGDLNKITEDISNKIPGIQIVTMSQVVNSLSVMATSAKILSLSIAIIAIIISAVGVMNSILTSVFERTSEIGIMRAIGASKFDIFRIIIMENILLSILGGVIGILFSVISSTVIEKFLKKFLFYLPSGKLITFEFHIALVCLIFSLFIGVVSGLYPAYRASKINPIEVIKT